MSDRFDVVQFKKTQSGKTYAVRLGSAQQNQQGNWNLYLDAMPASDGGQFKMTIVPPREKRGNGDQDAPF